MKNPNIVGVPRGSRRPVAPRRRWVYVDEIMCWRIVFYGFVLLVLSIPGFFFVGIVGRIAGFRPGSQPGPVEKAFGVFGIIVLGGIMLVICACAGFVDYSVTTFRSRVPTDPLEHPALRDTPRPKPLPQGFDEAKMEKRFLSDLQEFDVKVGWGQFGKRGDLGYVVAGGIQNITVGGERSANGISMHPPPNGHSTVKYRLNRTAKIFSAIAALNDSGPQEFVPQTAATFAVFGDGQLLWRSNGLTRHGNRETCRLGVEGVDVLELQVHSPGHNAHLWAVWVEPRILR